MERRLAYEEPPHTADRALPEGRAGRATPGELVTRIDLAPTLLELGGAQPTRRAASGPIARAAAARNESRSGARSVLIEYSATPSSRASATWVTVPCGRERYKFIDYLELDGMDELYDLEVDPFEMDNLVGLDRSMRPALEAELARLRHETAMTEVMGYPSRPHPVIRPGRPPCTPADTVDAGLVARSLGLEPVQNLRIHAQRNRRFPARLGKPFAGNPLHDLGDVRGRRGGGFRPRDDTRRQGFDLSGPAKPREKSLLHVGRSCVRSSVELYARLYIQTRLKASRRLSTQPFSAGADMNFKAFRAATLLALCLPLPALAGMAVDVEIRDRRSGRVLPVYWHDGERHVAGEPGREYEIRLRNREGCRVLAVTSVDGVNVITGRTASPSQSGYVLDPWGLLEIDGWRKSMDDVAAFYFTALPDSYAARTGRPDNVGVIGVALFRELSHPMPMEDEYVARADAPRPPRARPRRPRPRAVNPQHDREESRLGTGHGRRIDSGAVYTSFERASESPDEIVRIYYDSRKNLVARGVIPPPWRYAGREPEPFPQAFVPDP